MNNKTRILYFSHWLLILSFAAIVVNFLTNNMLFNKLCLQPSLVITNFEVWRLFTYTFLPGTFEGILISVFALGFISFNIENKFNKIAFPLILILLMCLQGTLFSLFFWKSNRVFSGMEGISLFIITLYILLEFPNKTRQFKTHAYSSVVFTGLITILWFVSVMLHHSFRPNEEALSSSITSGSFGISAGLFIFLQIKLTQYFRQKKFKASVPTYPVPEPEELSMAHKHKKEQYGTPKYYPDENYYPDSEEVYTEDRLNEILDKINERGKESLSPEELRYLRDYSRKLK